MCKAISNILFVGIWEVAVWLIFTLMFLDRYDLIDVHRLKEKIRYLLIPIIPTAIYLNLCMYIFHTSRSVRTIGGLIIGTLLVKYIIHKNPIKNQNKKYINLKIILFSFLGNVALVTTETIYQPIFMFILDKDTSFINNNIAYNFLMSTPSRILQILIIYVMYVNERYQSLIKQINYIVKSRVILISLTVLVILVVLSLLFALIMLNDFDILNHISFTLQTILALFLAIVPTAIVFSYVITFITMFSDINKIHKTYENELKQYE